MQRSQVLFLCVMMLFVASSLQAQTYNWTTCANWDFKTYENGKYWLRNNIWGAGSPGAGSQCTYANSERDWKVVGQHSDPGAGQVKGYPQVVRGWSVGDGWKTSGHGLPVQVSNLTKAKGRWKMATPTDGYYMCLWDLYLHNTSSPGTGTANINLQIFQYIRDDTGYFGSSTFSNLPTITIDGKTYRYKEGTASFATERVLTMFLMPYGSTSAPTTLGSQDAIIDMKGIIDFWKNAGKIPASYFLTSIQIGFEVIEGGTYFTQDFWTAIQNEPDGGGSTTTTVPSAPTNLSANAVSSSQINLSWTDNANNETAYKVERATTSGGPWTVIANLGANSTSYSVTGLNASTIYYFRVNCSNSAGNSGYTGISNATTNATGSSSSTNIYTDALAADWVDWSWSSTRDFNNGSPVRTGVKSVKVNYTSTFGGFSLRKGTAISTSNLNDIRFWVYSNAVRTLTFQTQSADGSGNSTSVSFTTTANAWKEIIITKAQLGNPALIKRINLQATSFTGEVIFDEIRYTISSGLLSEPAMELFAVPNINHKEMKIFPNPVAAGSDLRIVLNGVDTHSSNLNVCIYDMVGRQVFRKRITSNTDLSIQPLLVSGMYSLKIDDGIKPLLNQKLIVK